MDRSRKSTAMRTLWFLLIIIATLIAHPAAPLHRPLPVRPLADQNWIQNVSDEIGKSEYRYSVGLEGALWAPNRIQGLWSRATEAGLRLTPRITGGREGGMDDPLGRRDRRTRSVDRDARPAASGGAWEVGLRVERFGRKGALRAVPAASPKADNDRLEYRHDGFTEWYVNRPDGIEQGFTIDRRPPGGGAPESAAREARPRSRPLVIEMAVTGSLRASAADDGNTILFRSPAGEEILRYADLHVEDADGRPVEASLELETESRLRIEVQDDGAVYPLRVDPLLTSPSWMTESNQANAHLGIPVASAGDVNGDGFADVVVSAAWFDANGFTDQGRVWVFHGSAAGLSGTPAWFADGNQTAGFFGYSVASAGDVNKDGFGDLIVGADSYTNTLSSEGRAVLYLGSATGLRTTPAWTQYGGQAGAGFGYSVACAGDVNKDGYADVIISADLYDITAGGDQGRVYVYLGSAAGLPATAAWVVNGPQREDEFGWQVASAGDVNKDGYSDVIIGAPLFDPSASQADAGKAFVYLGSATGLAATPAWTAVNGQANSTFGYSVASAGDVNNDGYSDVLVGAHYYRNTLTNEGRAYLYRGSATGLGTTPAWTANGFQAGALFGNSVASAGDVDADGYSDILVGAFLYDNGTLTDAGRAQLFQGTASGPTINPVWTFDGPQAGAWVGWFVASAGDVNRDGFSDILVGAPVYANGQAAEGRAFAFLGSGPCIDRDGDGYGSPGGTGCRLGTVLDCNDSNPAINPGAAEICNGIDDNCDGRIDNAPVPAGAPNLTQTLSGTNTTLSWTTLSGATAYDLVMGDVGVLLSTGGDYTRSTLRCLGNDLTTTSYLDTHLPDPNQTYWFLVRGVNCGGAGTYNEGGNQSGSRDAGINTSVGACP